MRMWPLFIVLAFVTTSVAAQQPAPAPTPVKTQSVKQNCRSAKTGKFVTADFAKKHPKTTVCEAK